MKNVPVLFLFCIFVFFNCQLGREEKPESNTGDPNTEAIEKLELLIHEELNALESDTDYTLLIKADNGRSFSHSTGDSSETSVYSSASTSKWVVSAVILLMAEKEYIDLDDFAHDYINFWPSTGTLSLIKLRHLLSFTSGLTLDTFTNIKDINPSIEDQVAVIILDNTNTNPPNPGTEFYYASAHMQVAGLMAIKALDMALDESVTKWSDVFSWFKNQTGLFPHFQFDEPNTQTPLLAGGMHWNAREYMDFLEALYNKQIIKDPYFTLMMQDQFGTAVISNTNGSPARNYLKEDWHYGFGCWIECHESPAEFLCDKTGRVSSPGAFGAYPFIDFEHRYFGILARQGASGSYPLGYQFFASISSRLEQWADLNSQK
ncbi:MAG: serine hydrolase [Spirochaetales bacterium]|nr:serine hydrolase [Spirochaetales bacterium]